jgi:hypothetical protein
MVTCANGHYYDQEKNATCPYCANTGGIDMQTKATVVETNNNDDEKTAVYQAAAPMDDERTVYNPSSSPSQMDVQGAMSQQDDSSSEPKLLAGWLVIVSDQGRGTDYALTFGMNTIGRAESNYVSIQNGDSSISREKHAMIIYDYENNVFFIKHGEGQYLSYLNGEVLLDTKQLKANDRIKVGSTEMIFIPLCTDIFNWKD